MTNPLAAVLALCLAVPCFGQGRIWVVDAANGAGTHFRTIDGALVFAKDGDRIMVRKGTYSGFTVTRGVTIVGSPGVVIRRPCPNCSNSFIRIRLPAGQTFSLSHVDCQVGIAINSYFSRGRISFDSVTMSYPLGFANCDRASVVRCSVPSVQATNSNVVVASCRGLREVMVTKSSNVSLVNTPITGYPGYWIWGRFYPAPSAVHLDGTSTLALNGASGTLIQGGSTANPVIGTAGKLVLDPRVKLKNFATGGALIGSGVGVTRRTIPHLDARGAILGGTVRVRLSAGANQPFYLAVGAPGTVTAIPSLGGSVWLDLKTAILIASGRLDAKGDYAWSIPVPRDSRLLGLTLVWQGTAGATSTRHYLSNAAEYVHGF